MGSLKSSFSSQFAGESDLEMDEKGEVGGDEEMMIMENNNKKKKKEEEEMGEVVISIEEMLMELPAINQKRFMYKVPKLHRKINETVYTPQVISIGPFHHGQPELMAAEQYKLRALKTYLARINMRVEEAMIMACSWEEKARSCYAHPIHMNKQDFAKMILLDGCFILEFMNSIIIQRFCGEIDEDWIEYLLINGLMYDLKRDLTMLENQLPFFVLQRLFNLLPFPQNNDEDPNIYFMKCMEKLFIATTDQYEFPSNLISSEDTVKHLVDLLRLFYLPSPETEEYKKFIGTQGMTFIHPPTITELCDAGVKVQKAEKAKSFMDCSFKNGVLKIPPFIIHSNFEIHMRNLILSEIFRPGTTDHMYVFHYIGLLDGLINTEKDVSILVKENIITNDIGGSDQQVSELINNLRLNAPTFPPNFYFNNMSRDLNDYCNNWWHRSIALLRRDYFNTPWASISFFAATFLLILTLLQTLFSTPLIFHQ